MTCSGTGPVM